MPRGIGYGGGFGYVPRAPSSQGMSNQELFNLGRAIRDQITGQEKIREQMDREERQLQLDVLKREQQRLKNIERDRELANKVAMFERGKADAEAQFAATQNQPANTQTAEVPLLGNIMIPGQHEEVVVPEANVGGQTLGGYSLGRPRTQIQARVAEDKKRKTALDIFRQEKQIGEDITTEGAIKEEGVKQAGRESLANIRGGFQESIAEKDRMFEMETLITKLSHEISKLDLGEDKRLRLEGVLHEYRKELETAKAAAKAAARLSRIDEVLGGGGQ